MAGRIVLSTLNDDTGPLGTQNGMTGIAKAWVNFNGVPSTPTVRGSFNVGSVTKNSTGSFTVNFTTAMPNTTYSVQTMTGDFLSGLNTYDKVNSTNGLYTTSSVSVTCWYQPTTAYKDPEFAFVAILSS
jgi:hypothetical protein